MSRLHEAEVLAEYGELARPYAFSQIMTECSEAIGLEALSISIRDIDDQNIVLDFDGRPMVEKLEAACQRPAADFERQRNVVEKMAFQQIVEDLAAGNNNAWVILSGMPNVAPELAASEGYNPEFEFLGVQRYSIEYGQLVLRNYNLAGIKLPKILQVHQQLGGLLAKGATELDVLASPLPTSQSLESMLSIVAPEKDFNQIEQNRLALETIAAPFIHNYLDSIQMVKERETYGLIDWLEAVKIEQQLKRGLMTQLLVKLNPDRARLLLTDEDFIWMESMLEFSPDSSIAGAEAVADRNALDFIACGGISGPEIGSGELKGNVSFGSCRARDCAFVGLVGGCSLCLGCQQRSDRGEMLELKGSRI